MTAIEHDLPAADIHPIDIVESLCEQSAWDFDRVGEDQIAMAIEGAWRTYSLTLAWSGHDDLLRLICTFEITPPEERMGDFLEALNLVNERIWGGAFTYWEEQTLLAFRNALTLAGGAHATPEQVEAMVVSAIAYSERFYPAFQLVCWGGEKGEDALRVAIDRAYGTA